MFEHFSFRVPRYGEDAVRKNLLNRKVKFICTPEFEEIFNSLFKGVDFDKMMNEATKEAFKPRVVCVPVQDEGPEETKKEEPPFRWYTEDDDEDDEDEEPVKEPPSIFDMLNSGKNFGDIVSAKPKHTDIYNQAFGLDENGNPIPLPDYEDDEEDDEVKDPNVFIANRLTFLIQTKLPIIFDTSIIETGTTAKMNYMSIAVNVDKTYPKVETENDLVFIMREFNGSEEIQGEINEFLKDTEYDGIWAFPSTIERNDVKIPAVRFVIYPKRKYYSFGPAFLNRNK